MKKIKDDVVALVEHLKQTFGATWSVAYQPRAQLNSKLVPPAIGQRGRGKRLRHLGRVRTMTTGSRDI
eukprot:5343837-Pleurochrysis_carterae.AAC.1